MKKGGVDTVVLIVLVVILIGCVVYFGFTNKPEKTEVTTNSAERLTENTEKEVVVQTKTEVVKEEIKPLDLGKCQNSENTYNLMVEVFPVRILLDSTGKVTANYNQPADNVLNVNLPFGENVEITGFTKNVVGICAAGTGNGINCPLVLFLMEDGTVEYMKTRECFEKGTLETAGKVSGLENIVRLETALSMGYKTIVAVNKEGQYYDVSKMVSID
ncbi:MAG: hypothetical protein IJ809_06645 [Clostridia bacterium]|nr:hypothetical protein [Clostridia bacterium]